MRKILIILLFSCSPLMACESTPSEKLAQAVIFDQDQLVSAACYKNAESAVINACSNDLQILTCSLGTFAMANSEDELGNAMKQLAYQVKTLAIEEEEISFLLAVALLRRGARLSPCGAHSVFVRYLRKSGRLTPEFLDSLVSQGVSINDPTAILLRVVLAENPSELDIGTVSTARSVLQSDASEAQSSYWYPKLKADLTRKLSGIKEASSERAGRVLPNCKVRWSDVRDFVEHRN